MSMSVEGNDYSNNDNLKDQLFEYQLTVATMEVEMKSKEELYEKQAIEFQNEIRKLKQENGHLHYKYIQSKQKQQQQPQQPHNEPSLPTTTTMISTAATVMEEKESRKPIIYNQNTNRIFKKVHPHPTKNQITEWISMLHKGDNLLFMYSNDDENMRLVFKELFFLLMHNQSTKNDYEFLLPKLIAMNAQLRSYLRTCITSFTAPTTEAKNTHITSAHSRIQSKRRKGSNETAAATILQPTPDDNWKEKRLIGSFLTDYIKSQLSLNDQLVVDILLSLTSDAASNDYNFWNYICHDLLFPPIHESSILLKRISQISSYQKQHQQQQTTIYYKTTILRCQSSHEVSTVAQYHGSLDNLLELKVKIYQLFHQVIYSATKNFSLHNNEKTIMSLLYPENISNENDSTTSHSPLHNHDVQKEEKSSSVCEPHGKQLFITSLDELEGYLYPVLLKSIQFSTQDDSDNDTTVSADHHLNICLQLTVKILNLLSTLCQTSYGVYYIRYLFPKVDILKTRSGTSIMNNSTNGGNDGEDESNNVNDDDDDDSVCKTCSGISIYIQIFDLAARRQQKRRHNQYHQKQQHDFWWNMILENCLIFFNILSKHVTKYLRENEGITLSSLVQEQLLLFQAKCTLLLVCIRPNCKLYQSAKSLLEELSLDDEEEEQMRLQQTLSL